MRKALFATLAAAGVIATAAPLAAHGAPGWLRLLHWISGDDARTDVPVAAMDPHMQMSVRQPARPGDRDRAAAILAAAREALRRYPTEEAARRAGYRPFRETGALGEEVHFTSLGHSYAEGRKVDHAQPGSLLFRRTARGLVPVGVMYSAGNRTTAAELDARAPLSVATWHRHVNFCWALGKEREAENAGPRFGYAGSIADEATCRRERGYWLPLAFGWMTHVYPDRADPWGGEDMRPDQGGGHHEHGGGHHH
jgi:hypothetical protein